MVDNETRMFLCSGAFNDITFVTVSELLSRETLISSEIELFQAVFRWSGKQCLKSGIEATGENGRAPLGNAIYNIRFLAMTHHDFDFTHVFVYFRKIFFYILYFFLYFSNFFLNITSHLFLLFLIASTFSLTILFIPLSVSTFSLTILFIATELPFTIVFIST